LVVGAAAASERHYVMRPTPNTYSQARALLAEHGIVRPQVKSEWQGTILLPSDIAAYFEQIGPVDVIIPGYGNPTKLPSLTNLWQFQAGYRWNGITGEPATGWNDDWIVIASEGGDPYIFDQPSAAVLFARHGESTWRPRRSFPNLPLMISCLAKLGSIRRAAGHTFVDDDGYVRPAHRGAALTAITEITGSAVAAERVVSRAGWGEPRGG
jgi:hypothetical protein